MDLHVLTLSNLHCSSCEDTVKKILNSLSPAPTQVKVSLNTDTVAVTSPRQLSIRSITNALSQQGYFVTSVDNTPLDRREDDNGGFFWTRWRRRRIHRHNCSQCKENDHSKLKHFLRSSTDGSSDTEVEPSIMLDYEKTEYRATFSIGGMTCAACVNSVTAAVKDGMPEIENFEVNLMTKSGVAIIPDKRLTSKLSKAIEDAGFSCELVELLPVSSSSSWKIDASIGGMTCASCANGIRDNVKRLPFVQDIAIDLLSNSAVFQIDDKIHEPEIREAVENSGYNYELVSIKPIETFGVKTKSRSINLRVKGMFCEHCPEEVNRVLESYGAAVVIDDPISLDSPFIKFTYIPDPPRVAIRSIFEKIRNVSGKFDLEIVKPLSLEERSALMAKREERAILYRLGLSVISAIPTLIIGVVGMGLLKSTDSMRMYLEEPMWTGAVSRATWALFFLATPVYFYSANVFHIKAFHEIVNLWRPGTPWTRRLFKFGSMNTLMSLGTTIAYFASIALLILSARSHPMSMGYTSTYFDSVVFLTMFLLFGRFLDCYSKEKTASAVSMLDDLRPDVVTIVEKVQEEDKDSDNVDTTESDGSIHYGNPVDYPLDFLEVGDYIRISPGQSCTSDSIVVKGSSSFDESLLTGESLPVHKEKGDQVFGGTINNGTGIIIAKASATTGESLLDNILEIVRQGQMHRAPVERLAETITGVFVPIITALAVTTWIVWLALGFSGSLPDHYLDIDVGGWTVWSLQFSIAVFVVACPCGIGLAAPTAFYVGSGLAARYGILARGGGEAFQDGAKIDIVAFDKTGTLTTGNSIRIIDHYFEDEENSDEIIQLAFDIEQGSSHPLAKAMSNFALEISQVSDNPKISSMEEISGKGLEGDVTWPERKYLDGTKVYLGNQRLVEEQGAIIDSSLKERINGWQIQGCSILLLAVKTGEKCEIKAGFAAADVIRPESKSVIEELQKKDIICWMISGDNEKTAKSIARQVGIKEEHVLAGVLPQEKSDKISYLQKTGNSSRSKKSSRAIVAMVGDGVNDAPSLAVADVGIAIGSGSDIARSSAKFVLLNSNLNSILVLLDISKCVLRRVYFNFFWAGIYNIVGVPIAAGVIYPYNNSRLSPAWASLAMALSSVSVVMSSFLLKYHKPPKRLVQESIVRE